MLLTDQYIVMVILNILLFLSAFLISIIGLYYFVKRRNENYWRSKGLQIYDIGKFRLPEIATAYQVFKSAGFKHGVIESFGITGYVPIDLEILRRILQTDFQYFRNHGQAVDEDLDPLKAHIAFLTDEKWRDLRNKLTPTFTSGKMKMMFSTMIDCANELYGVLDTASTINEAQEFKDLMARYTTDIIGSCAFGIECKTIKNPDSDFRKYGDGRSHWRLIAGRMLPPVIKRLIRLKEIEPIAEKFYINLVREMVEYREKNNISRNDFLHLLLQLKNRGKLSDDNKIIDKDNSKTGNYMTLNQVAAQCFVFFIAGFDTSSTLMSFAFFELTQNQDIQDRLRDEIKTVLSRHNGKVTYEAIMEMDYLEQVLKEALRLYPPVAATNRICNTTYKVPGTDVVLEPGDFIWIPIMGIQRDPEYYPEPTNFDPDRFLPENEKRRHPLSFLPFGEGPRQCIGLRFGLLQSKIGLVTVLNNFKLTLNSRTKMPLEFKPTSTLTNIEGGVWINVTKLQDN